MNKPGNEYITSTINRYVNLRLGLIQLAAYENIAKIMGQLSRLLISIMIALFILLFASFTFAAWYEELTGSKTQGFLIVTLFDIVLLIVITLARNFLFVRPVERLLMSNLLKTTNDFDPILESIKDESSSIQIKLLKMKFKEELNSIESQVNLLVDPHYWWLQIQSRLSDLFGFHQILRWFQYFVTKYYRKYKKNKKQKERQERNTTRKPTSPEELDM